MRYDVIVVGGGPAGATAARITAEKGLSVLLLEKFKFDREKACGGVVQGITLERFDLPKKVKETFERNAMGAFLCAPSGNYVKVLSEEPLGKFVWRSRFDKALVEWAHDKGAETRELTRVSDLIIKEGFVRGVVVKSKGKTEDLEAGVVIGADGFYSFVARRLGLLQTKLDRIAAQYSFHMAMPEREIDEKIGDVFESYYGTPEYPANMWISPKKEGVSVAAGIMLSEMAEMKMTLRELVSYMIKHHPIMAEKLKNAKTVLEQPSMIFYPGTVSKPHYNGAILAGEAAGHTVAATGAGIHWSMVGGEHAATAVANALEKDDVSEAALSEGDRLVKEEIGEYLELGMKMRAKTFDVKGREMLIEGLKASEAARKMFLEMLSGKARFTETARFW